MRKTGTAKARRSAVDDSAHVSALNLRVNVDQSLVQNVVIFSRIIFTDLCGGIVCPKGTVCDGLPPKPKCLPINISML